MSHAGALPTVLLVPLFITIAWAVPINLGISAAVRKGYSPHWMWLGIHPGLGWITCLVLLALRPRPQCPRCLRLVAADYRVCPSCGERVTEEAKGPWLDEP